MNNRSINLLILLFFIIIFSSCNNPLHRTYNITSYDDDMEAIRKSSKVSDEDLELMNKYIMLIKLSGNNITGKSYEEILDKIKTFRQKTNESNEENLIIRDAKRQRLSPFVEVKLLDKTFSKVDNKNILNYTIAFKNTATFTIKTITGSIDFDDAFEKPIKNLSIFLDEDITPNKTLTKTYNVDYNDADESDRSIRVKDVRDVKTFWNPDKIIFENGKLAD